MNHRDFSGRRTLLAFLSLAAIALPACGRKTDVKPPELVAPEIVAAVTAQNMREGVRVRWMRPRHYADGATMRDLAGFRLERSRADAPFAPIATIPVVDRDRFRQARRFEHVDADVEVGERYGYRVFAFTEDGHTSPASVVAEIVRAVPEEDPKDE